MTFIEAESQRLFAVKIVTCGTWEMMCCVLQIVAALVNYTDDEY